MREALEQPGLISLAAGFTDNPSLPVAESRAIIDGLYGDAKANHICSTAPPTEMNAYAVLQPSVWPKWMGVQNGAKVMNPAGF